MNVIPVRSILSVLLALLMQASASAQEAGPEADLAGLVRDGAVAQIEARLGGRRGPEELLMLASAQANAAAKLKPEAARFAAFEDAERRYRAWIVAVETQSYEDTAQREVGVAKARIELAGMLLWRWAGRELDAYELVGGQKTDAKPLRAILSRSIEQSDQARTLVAGWVAELARESRSAEDRLLALGIFDEVQRLDLEIDFLLGWAHYFSAWLLPPGDEQRAGALRLSERAFQDLTDRGVAEETGPQVALGMALVLREQGRVADAERSLQELLAAEGLEPRLAAQVRYELARCQMQVNKFAEVRLTLRPLLETDPQQLSPEQRSALFYYNLARLVDARSYLAEAAALRGDGREELASSAIGQRAQRLRDEGLRRFQKLARQGGDWPAVVQGNLGLYVAAADPKAQSPVELLFGARQLEERARFADAEALLREALGRPQLEAPLASELLYELGVSQFQGGRQRDAAETFAKVASDHRGQAEAPRAIGLSVQLWSQIADSSKSADDYRRLADVLLVLLQHFPEHPDRVNATWWLPVALEFAGEHERAAAEFGKIPADSPHAIEAQYRRLSNLRRLLESRQGLSAEQRFAEARRIAGELSRFARGLSDAKPAGDASTWASNATVEAAELLVQTGVAQHQQALELLRDFEERFPDSPLFNRVVAVRVQAHQGQREFEQAAHIVQQALERIPSAEAMSLLLLVAQGMQDEVEQLQARGDQAGAKRIADQAIAIFETLRVRYAAQASPDRAAQDAIEYGLGRMKLVAGDVAGALAIARDLSARDARSGHYQWLLARALTDSLGTNPPAEQAAGARVAWTRLLADANLRAEAPQRYWEARYELLRLLLREGRAAEVAAAIRQERVWQPELGGDPSRARLEALLREAEMPGGDAATSKPR